MVILKSALFLLSALVSSGLALACSACIWDAFSPEELDRMSWEESDHVVLGLVVGATLIRETSEIEYQVEPEEVFKGTLSGITRIYSRSVISDVARGQRVVGCGEAAVPVGVHVLLFSGRNNEVHLGPCSKSRVMDAHTNDEIAAEDETLRRIRNWASQ